MLSVKILMRFLNLNFLKFKQKWLIEETEFV